MADGKISVDLDKLYSERKKAGENGNSGNQKPKSLDELRAIDQEDRLMENMMGRGKMTMPEYLMWKDIQMKERQTQNPVDIEAIIAKATEPFRQQIEEMKRQQERAEQEKKYDALQTRIDKLTDLITSGAGSNKTDPIIEEIKGLKQQLADEKEKAAKKDMDDFKKTISGALDGISDEIYNIRSKGPEKTQTDLERLEGLITMQERYRKVLGIKDSNSKDDEASTTDLLSTGIDMFNDKAPKLVKTIGTLREGLKGGSDLPDDVPYMDNIPTQLPSRNVPRANKSSIPPDILDFLNSGEDTENGYVDLSGVQWQNEFTGKPLTRSDIEAKAISDPDSVRQLMELAYEDLEKAKVAKPKAPPKVPKAPKEAAETKEAASEPAKVPDAEKEQRNDNEDAEQNTVTKETETDRENPLKDAMAYINAGTEKEDSEGRLTWVGTKNETYEADDGPMTREQLLKEARDDPKAFMQTVRQHIESLGE